MIGIVDIVVINDNGFHFCREPTIIDTVMWLIDIKSFRSISNGFFSNLTDYTFLAGSKKLWVFTDPAIVLSMSCCHSFLCSLFEEKCIFTSFYIVCLYLYFRSRSIYCACPRPGSRWQSAYGVVFLCPMISGER